MLAVALVVQQAVAENSGERIAQKGAKQPGAVACASCHGAACSSEAESWI
jgi:cytochrome c553